MKTVWLLGDQLNRNVASLGDATPDRVRLLMVESSAKIGSKPFHRQRLHFIVASMRRFAAEMEAAGFEVDYRKAPSMQQGFRDHLHDYRPDSVEVMEPMSWVMRQRLANMDVTLVRSNQFLCHYEDFAAWAEGRKRMVMEDFYRWQRSRLGYLMDGDDPVGGTWNYDEANREPPPHDGRPWPQPQTTALDALDRSVIADLPETAFGADPDGTWATTRHEALRRLEYFVESVLPGYGPYQDAMLAGNWSMAHSLLSPYLNIGLLMPDEVCDAAAEAYRSGAAPIESVEGFIRQIIGWREYVWGVYWLWMPEYQYENRLGGDRAVPPAITTGDTDMRCVADSRAAVEQHAYAHHIQRLMIFGNLGLTAGIDPQQLVEWMWASFIDGAEWVMLPNVIGMALHADGGQMATKPYAAGGNYISKMSDYCRECRYNPKQRTGPDACPFTTLYWDFLDRNREALAGNHRMARQLAAAGRLQDMPAVRDRARDVLELLDSGSL